MPSSTMGKLRANGVLCNGKTSIIRLMVERAEICCSAWEGMASLSIEDRFDGFQVAHFADETTRGLREGRREANSRRNGYRQDLRADSPGISCDCEKKLDGSSMVIMVFFTFAVDLSSIAGSVVDLPEPVVRSRGTVRELVQSLDDQRNQGIISLRVPTESTKRADSSPLI